MTGCVRVGLLLALSAPLLCRCAAAAPQSTTNADDSSAHAIYGRLNALRVDPGQIYSVHNLDLRRDTIHFSFYDGQIAFFEPFDGKITGAVFSGSGHILAIPRDPTEKISIARFLGAPLLDQHFEKACLRFDDDTAAELTAGLRATGAAVVTDPATAEDWDATVASLNPSHSLRILTDLLSEHPASYFYAGLMGDTSGPFDVLVDNRRAEQIMFGQPKIVNDLTFYDVWASYPRQGAAEPPALFAADHYALDTTVQFDMGLSGNADLTLRALRGGERVIPLELSNHLRVETVTDEPGRPLEFFQSDAAVRGDIAAQGNNALTVILPVATVARQVIRLRVTYRGTVINNGGNGVYFVGAHGTWYPHVGGIDSSAVFDLKFRWPKQLRLVATGQESDEHEEGDWRVASWHSERPFFMAGFNLGQYRTVSVESAGVKVNLYENEQLDAALQSEMKPSAVATPIPEVTPQGAIKPSYIGIVPQSDLPSATNITLHSLGEEIEQAMQFFTRFGGPFPYSHLEVSQIPGTFGQGWPELLYIPTFSFLSPEAQHRLGLSTSKQQHFTEIVPYHEVAHQWWGNLVVWHSYRDQWLAEGLVNYIALMFADSRKDSGHALYTWLGRYRDNLTADIPGKDDIVDSTGPLSLGYRLTSSVNPGGYEDVIYAKGTWVFHMLRMMLRDPEAKDSDHRFTTLIHSLTDAHRDAALSTDDLQRAVESVMPSSMDLEGGHSMAWFFDEWVRGTGIPRYKAEFSTQRSGDQFIVRGVLQQQGVPSNFIAPVPLYVAVAGGKSVFLGRVIADGARTPFRFTTHVEPKRILVDPEMTVLCTAE
jgi:hypothetical protein